MKTRCIIVDDEPLAIEVIKNHLGHFDDMEVVAECKNAIEAGNEIRKQPVDLVFLDIQMPKITGFEFLASLNNPPKIIITTAFRNYAIKSYEFEIIDYLLKPIPFPRFLKAINKFHKTKNDQKQTKIIAKEKNDTFIYVNEEKNIHKIYLKDILFIESYREYIKIHTEQKTVSTKVQISKIAEKLPDEKFMRIHKSFIVPIEKISSFNARSVNIGKTELPIGRTYKERVIDKLKSGHDFLQ